jgi:hypothetical protein
MAVKLLIWPLSQCMFLTERTNIGTSFYEG